MHTSPTALRRTLEHAVSAKPQLEGLDVYWHKGRGTLNRLACYKQRFLKRARAVLQLEDNYACLTNARLQSLAMQKQNIFRRHRDTPRDLEHAFALLREVAFRQNGEKPYLVQVMGAFALAQGCIAEMATGEGKTLCATLPATIAGWRGLGCHIITVNDYLAQRDAEWMGRIYRFCGLRASHLEQGMDAHARKYAYQADITYCTNKEVCADFLRDQIVLGSIKDSNTALLTKLISAEQSPINNLVQRGLNYAIVDEADSILIDEAVTPLIISGAAPNEDQLEAFQQAATLVTSLEPSRDYTLNRTYHEVTLTDEGKTRLNQRAQTLGGIWDASASRRHHEIINKALVAREYYTQDKHYVIDNEKVVIVDDFTGRLMPDRSWRDGLHQAIEAKEGLEVTPVKDTYARISFQRFFRLYRTLAGMTGTGAEARSEFWNAYHLPVVVIPPNRPCQRKRHPDIITRTEEEKWHQVTDEINCMIRLGRPVLVGTRSVRASEHLSRLLTAKHSDHQVLNAVRHQEEASIVSLAGQAGRITVATNIAGRGTDIKLGPRVGEAGGLHVIAADMNESDRIDRQLFGRCARQGDPGSRVAIVSLEDELIKRHGGSDRLRNVSEYSPKYAKYIFKRAQRRAQRQAQSQRRNVVKNDRWLNEHLGFTEGL
jgi:preprotein translocase subunit SecA